MTGTIVGQSTAAQCNLAESSAIRHRQDVAALQRAMTMTIAQTLPAAGATSLLLRNGFRTESPGVHETLSRASRPSTLWSGLTARLPPRGVVRVPRLPTLIAQDWGL